MTYIEWSVQEDRASSRPRLYGRGIGLEEQREERPTVLRGVFRFSSASLPRRRRVEDSGKPASPGPAGRNPRIDDSLQRHPPREERRVNRTGESQAPEQSGFFFGWRLPADVLFRRRQITAKSLLNQILKFLRFRSFHGEGAQLLLDNSVIAESPAQ